MLEWSLPLEDPGPCSQNLEFTSHREVSHPILLQGVPHLEKGRYKATWKMNFNLAWREADPPNHLDDEVDSDQ